MISEYERMEQLAYENDVSIFYRSMTDNVKGFYYSINDFASITLNQSLETTAEKSCVLAEEVEHFLTTPINLLSATAGNQEKYEHVARWGAVRRLVPLRKLIDAKYEGVGNIYELAEYLNVTEDFLSMALNMYREHYGLEFCYGRYIIKLNPIDVYYA
jgi:Zn-dependent peptidase ImmA (M78 family)